MSQDDQQTGSTGSWDTSWAQWDTPAETPAAAPAPAAGARRRADVPEDSAPSTGSTSLWDQVMAGSDADPTEDVSRVAPGGGRRVAAAPADAYEPPTYQPPTYEAPSYEPPTYEAPSYEAPAYEPPTYETPTPVYREPEPVVPAVAPVTAAAPVAAAPVVAAASVPEHVEPEHVEPLGLDELLTQVVELSGSDLHLTVGVPPTVRVRGEMRAVEGQPALEARSLQEAVYAILTEKQRKTLEETRELDFAYTVPGVARFRANVFWQRSALGAVLRLIPWEIKTVGDLGLPAVVSGFAELKRGLVLVTGPTGSGKSTTLAAVIDQVNRTRRGHIMTIEDPIEFLHDHKGCIVNQREVGGDTLGFRNALRQVLRQDPDVVLVGELRDLETISVALTAAETGHLVLATLHTQSAQDTVSRVVDVFPAEQQQQIRTQLAATLQGVVCQTLVPTADGRSRTAALEIMVCTTGVRAMIRENKLPQIPGALQAGVDVGMQTLDGHLADLVKQGRVTRAVALEHCADKESLLALITSTGLRGPGQGGQGAASAHGELLTGWSAPLATDEESAS
ncbi:type IV pilus twitching motility protein PilT [Nocardioides bruguierae]|uniref:type IV pilus twitching motility protein PilT n=1 Tax=Nocardioides bruguierae TaxID=2945102 RepID=UPI0027DF4A3C|nr:type IV pilus twitching motility protein PilT [Nocardioides bruguierae]